MSMDRMAKIIAVGEAEHEVTARRAAEAERAAVVARLTKSARNYRDVFDLRVASAIESEIAAINARAHLETPHD
jgi:hypothetical protein